jgi:hypothetical protein
MRPSRVTPFTFPHRLLISETEPGGKEAGMVSVNPANRLTIPVPSKKRAPFPL